MEDMTDNNETVETAESQEESRTYSFEEVQALLQSEGDKRVTQALKKERAKHEKELSLRALDGDKREKEEQRMRIAELEEQLAQYQVEKNRSELKSVLSSRGLPAEMADIINVTDDLEESQERIQNLDRLFKAAVKAEVEKRLAGSAPKGNVTISTGEITPEQFKAMSLAQMTQLLKENPELYRKLSTTN